MKTLWKLSKGNFQSSRNERERKLHPDGPHQRLVKVSTSMSTKILP